MIASAERTSGLLRLHEIGVVVGGAKPEHRTLPQHGDMDAPIQKGIHGLLRPAEIQDVRVHAPFTSRRHDDEADALPVDDLVDMAVEVAALLGTRTVAGLLGGFEEAGVLRRTRVRRSPAGRDR